MEIVLIGSSHPVGSSLPGAGRAGTGERRKKADLANLAEDLWVTFRRAKNQGQGNDVLENGCRGIGQRAYATKLAGSFSTGFTTAPAPGH